MKYNLTDINTIKSLIGEENFRFSKSKGQNFLKENWVVEDAADAGCISGDCGVLEIGPGIGCLTVKIAERSKKVVSVEIDESLRPLLKKTLSEYDNSEVIYGDIMKLDISELVSEHFGDISPLAVCANLPYNITTPVLTKLTESGLFQRITVMIQKEVAERICAKPGTQEWGAFSVLMQWYFETEKLFDVASSCFIPAPKVTSSVIKMEKRSCRPAEVCSEELMFKIVRAVFNQRRKTLTNSICNAFSGTVTKEHILNVLKEMELPATTRGETFSIAQFAEFTDRLNSAACIMK